jgi:CheY-like chemotaxis protein
VVKERPALLIADVMVRDMNGSEVVKQLLATSVGGELKALLLHRRSSAEETAQIEA